MRAVKDTIEKPVLELPDIAIDTPLRITTDGSSLIISPVRDRERGTLFEAALDRVNRNHSKTLRRLAE